MITNESVQRLIACDRETLVDLMAAAMAAGSFGGSGVWNVWQDGDIRALIEAARARNARPERWGLSRDRWNAEMNKL